MSEMDYEAACKHAATAQGLDPFVDAARAAGLNVEVWQTGGFCMVAAIAHPTRADWHYMVTDEGGCLVTLMDNSEAGYDDAADTMEVIADHVPVADAVAAIHTHSTKEN